MNYYKRHLGDYAKDTKRLTIYEHGVYNVLLDEYYSQETPLTDQDIEELIQPNGQKEKNSVEKVLKRYFKRDGNFWRHSYADRVIEAAQAKSQKAAESASKRWEKSKDESKIKYERNANAYETHCESECVGNASHKPLAISQDTTEPYSGSSVSKNNTPSLRSGVSARAKKTETPIPENFGISDEVRRWAEKRGYGDLEAHLESFKDKVSAKGYRYIDWDSAFKNAIREDWGKIRTKPPPNGSAHYRPSLEERNKAAAEEARILLFGNDDERNRLRKL